MTNTRAQLSDEIRKLNFGQRTQFVFNLRCIAGNGWDYVDDCDQEDIEAALQLTLNPQTNN